eukprot:PhF_6_TR19198/c0_g1_i1/m.28230
MASSVASTSRNSASVHHSLPNSRAHQYYSATHSESQQPQQQQHSIGPTATPKTPSMRNQPLPTFDDLILAWTGTACGVARNERIEILQAQSQALSNPILGLPSSYLHAVQQKLDYLSTCPEFGDLVAAWCANVIGHKDMLASEVSLDLCDGPGGQRTMHRGIEDVYQTLSVMKTSRIAPSSVEVQVGSSEGHLYVKSVFEGMKQTERVTILDEVHFDTISLKIEDIVRHIC